MLVRQSVLLLAHIRAGTAVNTSYQASDFNSNISINILVLYCRAPTAMKFCWCHIKTLAHVMLKSYRVLSVLQQYQHPPDLSSIHGSSCSNYLLCDHQQRKWSCKRLYNYVKDLSSCCLFYQDHDIATL